MTASGNYGASVIQNDPVILRSAEQREGEDDLPREDMKTLVSVLVGLIAILVILLVKRGSRSASGSASVINQQMTLERKLEVLANCGLKLAPPFTVSDLLTSFGREAYEEPGFDMVLVGLGMTEEQEPWRSHCVNLWHFDTECIEGQGAYERIAKRMAEITQGALSLENIQDNVDLEKREAWFSFVFQGQETKIKCKVEDDWVDARIFAKFVDLLSTADPSRVYIYYDLGGQDCIIGCVSKDQLKDLKRNGMKFVPLT